MLFKLSTKSDATLPTIITAFEDKKVSEKPLGKSKKELLNLHLKKKTFTGEAGKKVNTHISSTARIQKIMLLGAGKNKKLNEKTARNIGAQIIKAASAWEEKNVAIIIPKEFQEHLQAFSEGITMGQYNPAVFKTGKEAEKRQKRRIKTVHLIADNWTKDQENALEKGNSIAETVNYIRNIVNCGPKQLSTNQFVKEVKEVAKTNKYKITDMNKKQLTKLKMGGILAVNRGSEEPAHMMILEHNNHLKEDPIVICGKGIIFDTGGISLKPPTHMHEMQLDMAGAAVVLGVFKLLKKLKIPRRVIGVMPITDNAIGNNAYRPSEIVTTYSGKTVEIMNTDAEGRMILSDALSYSDKNLKPKYLIDIATLTGACMVALGFRTAGLFGNDKTLIDKILESGVNTDEPICNLPITDVDEKAMKGKIADLANLAGDHSYAGSARAAAFLKNFVGKSKWAHIDLAGPAFTKNPKPYETSMGTGYGIRMIIDFLEKMD
jgi:leucyl aminopeptidase